MKKSSYYKRPLISIITVSYNSSKFLTDYFQSIISLPEFKTGLLEVLMYEASNSSDDVEIINRYASKYPKQITVFTGSNKGFSWGNNYLSTKSKGKYLFFLNPDTKLDIHFFNDFVDVLSFNSIFIPTQLTFDKKFLNTGVGVDIFGFPLWRSSRFPFYADGAAFIMSKKMFLHLNGFDEDYFMFQEDMDLSWRALLLGYSLSQLPNSIVYHYSGGSVSGGAIRENGNSRHITSVFRRYYAERNNLTNLLKNYSLTVLLLILPFYFTLGVLESLVFLINGNYKMFLCYYRAYYWNLITIKNIMYKRKFVQNTRVVTDFYILNKMCFCISKFKLFLSYGLPKT